MALYIIGTEIEGFDEVALIKELIAELGFSKDKWDLAVVPNTSVEFVKIDELLDDSGVDALILAHGTAESSLARLKVKLQDQLDLYAGQRRAEVVANGSLIDQEYIRAYNVAKAWADGGYVEPAPLPVTCWAGSLLFDAATKAVTQGATDNEKAANNIIATNDYWMVNVIDAFRDKRITGKSNIEGATTEAAAQLAYDNAIASFG